MICFWGTNSNVNYKRDHSLLVSNIGWDKKCEFNDVIKILDKILENPADIYVKINVEDDTSEENFTYKDFFLLLARSFESLCSVTDSVSKTIDLIQLASNSSHITMDVAPIFIVPGIMGHTCKYFKEFVRKLMFPTYVVNLNDSENTIKYDALVIVEKIKQIYDGPYNIVGVSWGGALAIEIAKIFENHNDRIQLYLIDAIPETIQSIITEDGHNDNLEVTLLLELLQSSQHGLPNNLNWQDSIHAVAQSLNYSKRESQKLELTMNFVKNKLQRIIQYKPSDKLVNGLTRLLKPQDSSKDYSYNIMKYCKQVKIEMIKGNHFTMLQTDALAEYVNKNAIRRKFY
ncbi:Fatty acid synthase 3, partial [Carabus blaptoides fortunei]